VLLLINSNCLFFIQLFCRYRLIRHVWSFNVNESISVECNCHIINENTNNLGIDINVKNLNEIHHPLMTEILPYNLYLLCPNFKYNADNVFCKYFL